MFPTNGFTRQSQPVVVKGFPFAAFQANAEAQCPASAGWTTLGFPQFDGINYFQTFRQFFPLRQFTPNPSTLGVWTTTIPRAWSPWFGR